MAASMFWREISNFRLKLLSFGSRTEGAVLAFLEATATRLCIHKDKAAAIAGIPGTHRCLHTAANMCVGVDWRKGEGEGRKSGLSETTAHLILTDITMPAKDILN